MSSYARRLPEAQRQTLRRAQRLQVLWIFVLLSIIAAIYLSAGNSQAMKTAWIEDTLSLIPPIAFLLAGSRAGSRAPAFLSATSACPPSPISSAPSRWPGLLSS